MLAIGRRYLREADAADGFQETFVAVFQRIDKFEAIERPPDKYRVVLLRDIDGYSTEETALLLGIKMNAAEPARLNKQT